MAKGFKHGAGGGGLNFKIVGGTTEPTNLKENTIWVDTDEKITGYIFSAAQPTNPTEGLVWFFTAAPSTIQFNALKKNGIEVYPITARQYLGGAWVNRTAKIQQDGKLEELMLLLYRPGDECTDITGGWVARAVPRASGGTAQKPTITRKEDSISFQLVADRGTSGVVNLVNKIDLTGKKVIRFYGSKSGASTSDTCILRLWSALGSYSDASVVAEVNLHSYPNFEQEPIAIDISGLTSGSYYLGIAFRSYESARPVITFNRIEVA